MSICEGRLEVERPAPLLRKLRRATCSSGLAPVSGIPIPPDCIVRTRKTSSGQSDAMSPGKLAYAVGKATQVEENDSDQMLLKHVAAGDKAAMHILFARHRGKVFRFIQRMVRNPAIAEDLASQVFLDVWRSANRFEHRARVSTWLLSIARFKAINALRRRAYENVDQEDVPEIADAADTPEAALDRKETSGILQACINRLSPAHREIIDLFYYREKSVAELSEVIGIPIATVKSRIFYARKQLAKMLVSSGFDVAAAGSAGLPLKMSAGSSVISQRAFEHAQ
jgi:RNA polymerase sigma-70 factor, ECF subfamily